MGRVLVVGSSNTDLVVRVEHFPVPGETIFGRAFAIYPGGKGANQAVAAARAGAQVSFAGAVGGDAFGGARREDLAGEGIDVALVKVARNVPSGVALIVVDQSGQNQIVVVPGANDAMDVELAREAAITTDYEVLSLTLEVPIVAVEAALRHKRNRALAVVNAAPFDMRVRDILAMTDVLIVNEVEAAALLGRDLPIAAAEDAARDLQRLGARAAIITLGEDGAVVAVQDQSWRVAAPVVEAVDTTAAGDAFCGTVAAWLADGHDLVAAVRAGVAAAALAVTREGAQPSLARRDEIERMVALLPDDGRP